MPVTTQHPDYALASRRWRRIRDAVDGRDALVQAARQAFGYYGNQAIQREWAADCYILPLSGQTPVEYAAYVDRACYFNATGRTLDVLAGLIMAKEPAQELPTAIEAYAEDITLAAQNLREFAGLAVAEEIETARVGMLVDYPQGVPAGISVADAERLNARPFAKLYKAESIINWRVDRIGGVEQPTLVVLSESLSVPSDEYAHDAQQVYRVLDLFEGRYRQRLLADNGDLIGDEVFPTMRGQPMGFIPFTIPGGFDVRKPWLLDIADLNLAHYRNSADYEHGLHFTGLPTPYATGIQDSNIELRIGSGTAWLLPDPASKAGYLEFTGQGLGALSEAMAAKQQQMAVLGARMLTDEKRSAEAQGTVESRSAGERSMLSSIARDVSDSITRCLNWMAEWVGAPQTASYTLNTDYGAHRMEPAMLRELMAAYQGGSLPLSVLVENLKRGEIVAATVDVEAYRGELETDAPQVATPSQDPGVMAGLRSRLGL